MNKMLQLLLLVIIFIAGCNVFASKEQDPTTVFKANDPEIIEVFVLEEEGHIHYWKEGPEGVIAESGRLFSHRHDADSLGFTEFKIEYCLTGRKSITEIAYKDAKFLHDLMASEEKNLLVKLVY